MVHQIEKTLNINLRYIKLVMAEKFGRAEREEDLSELIHQEGGEEVDDKLLAVPRNGVFSEIETVEQLDERFPGALSILAAWFTHYKGPGRIEVKGYRSAEAAIALIQAARPRPE